MPIRLSAGQLGAGWMLLAAVFFSLMSMFVKLGSAHFSSFEMLFWRTSIGALCLVVACLWLKSAPWTPYWKGHIRRSFIGYLSMSALFYSLTKLPLSTAVTLNYTSSLFFALTCIIRLKDRVSLRTGLSLIIGFGGIVFLLKPTFSADYWLAGVLGLFSGLTAGISVFEVRELGKMGESPWKVVFWFFVLTSFFSLGVILCSSGFTPVSVSNLPSLLGVGVFGMLGQLAMTQAYKAGSKYLVASFAYMTVVFSALIGVMLWDDPIDGESIMAMFLIMGSGMFSALNNK